jgi:hypothetical protein
MLILSRPHSVHCVGRSTILPQTCPIFKHLRTLYVSIGTEWGTASFITKYHFQTASTMMPKIRQNCEKNKKLWEELIAYFLWYDTDRIENDASNNSIVARVFVAAVKSLPSRCLATIGGYTYRLMGGIFNSAVEMGSCAVIYVPSFIKIGSGVQKLTGGIHKHTHSNVIL